MDKIEKQLKKANERLKASNTGIKIFRRGQKLSLRGMLPKRNGEGNSQQILSLGIYCNVAGIQRAEKQAQKLASQLALKEFKWDEWLSKKESVGTVDYWVEEFEADYFNRKEKNNRTLTTWKTDYHHIFKRLNSTDNLTDELLIQLVLSTEPDSRQRQRAVMATSALAEFAKINVDLARYKGNYNYLKNEDRILPTEEEIINYYWSIPNPHWQRAFGLMAAYGVSNHELFYVDLDSLNNLPGHLISSYRKAHYGVRRIWCLYPEWYQEWELNKHIDLPKVNASNNRDLGHRVSTAFRRYGLCKPGDLRHCWSIRAIGFMPDSMAAKMQAHSVEVHNRTYKRWMDENHEDRFYYQLMNREDRPKPPLP